MGINTTAISRIAAAVIVIVLVVIAGVAIFFVAVPSSTVSISSSTVITSSSITSSSSSSVQSSSVFSSSASSTVSSNVTGGTLAIDDQSYPSGGLNELLAIQTRPYPDWMEEVMYQSLVVPNLPQLFNSGNITYMPDLAVNWTVSPDGETFTYNLRQGVQFSNGDPFNSYQVWTEMYGWYYLNGGGTNFLNGLSLFNTTGVNFGPTQIALLNSSGLANPSGQALTMMTNQSWPIYTTGPYQIVFRLAAPFIWLNALLSGFQGLLFDSQYVLQNGGFGTPGSFNNYFNTNAIPGTGPYLINSVQVNTEVTFAKNPNYWGTNLTSAQISANPVLNPGVYQKVTVIAVTDDLSRYTALSSGQVQMAAITTNYPLAANQSQFSFFQYQIPSGVGALAFNTQIYPTNITAVRQAIAHAINYTDIIDKVYYGRAEETVGPASPNYGQFYDPGNLSAYSYNMTEAQAYLASAGFANGKGLPQLSITVPAGMAALTLESQIIQADLEQIGLNVNIQTMQYADFQDLYGNFAFNLNNSANIPEMTFLGGGPAYLPDYLAPTDYWVNFVTNYSLFANYAIYNNPIVDSNVAFMSNTSNVATIVSHLQIAEQQIYNDVPYAWLPAPQLWLGDGSFFWNNHVISQVWFDPGYGGINDCPLFNTVVLASS